MTAAAFLLCAAVLALREHHMHQLNSYRADSHIRWLKRTLRGYLKHRILLIPLLAAPFLPLPSGVFAALCVAQALLELDWPRREAAKKPLVFTPRVKRMLATHCLLCLLCVAAACRGGALVMAVALFLTPALVLLSDLINSPIERAINRRYIGEAARLLRSAAPRLTVIGVTGSYGKTSVKYFLSSMLSAKFNTLMTPASFNTTLGVVKTVRSDLRPVHEVFICEMGARRPGDVREICELVHPKLGVITSIGKQHLETFRTLGNVARTKLELADALPDDGVLFISKEALLTAKREEISNNNNNTVTFSASDPDCDYAALDVRTSPEGSSFRARLPSGSLFPFNTRLIGRHNVANILAAIAVADSLGVPVDEITAAVRRLAPVPHRLEVRRAGGLTIIDDAFNSNEMGAAAALETLALFHGVKVIMTPGIVEMGEAEDEANRRLGAAAAQVCDFVFTIGKQIRGGGVGKSSAASVRAGALDAGMPKDRVVAAESLASAFERVREMDAVVLIENDLPDNY
ncbi:MAG: UDP-N-acetylmuramoyl-tripeptide--D-alanyl-D-alanine ligase [Synergistaceae bacterium]|jgi:UDP-N-acetylmuramoyl-tripeptide--D-alanyl-D-alanine ligase|nr:UDP-N-acetylmuramoyl-tripeptide--D-alanyl-D-alanine ligase [Synergistaceae bacterium]